MDRPFYLQERRTSNRIPITLEAIVYYNTLMLPDCSIVDLSNEGAFVSTGGHYIPDRAMIDLAINIRLQDLPQRFSARVMRSTEEGVGVHLQDVEPLLMRRVIEAMYVA